MKLNRQLPFGRKTRESRHDDLLAVKGAPEDFEYTECHRGEFGRNTVPDNFQSPDKTDRDIATDVSIGVVIVNYNGGEDLLRCLQCLHAMARRPRAIIVVDNNSDDGSREHCSLFDGVTLIRNPVNEGYAGAVNIGVGAIQACDWVAILNPDVFVRPKWLESLEKAVLRYPEAKAFASCMISHDDPDTLDGEGDVYHFSGLAWRHHHGMGVHESTAMSQLTFSACGGAALYHRKTFLDLHGYDEDFFCYMEDVDLGWRLQLAGHDCIYVHEAKVEHVGSSTVGVASDFQIYYGHRNMVWAWIKNMPTTLLVLCLPLHILVNLAAVFIYCFRGRGGIVLRAKYDALVGLPGALKKRRDIQRMRVRSRRALWHALDKRVWRARFQ